MGNLGFQELLVIFLIALIVIGPRKLPEVAKALGEAVRAFRDAMKDDHHNDRAGSIHAGEEVPQTDGSAADRSLPPPPPPTT